MNRSATVVLVRERDGRNHPGDLRQAEHAARQPPCFIVLVGAGGRLRREDVEKRVGVRGIASKGVNVFSPDELDPGGANTLAARLAEYLSGPGLRIPYRNAPRVRIQLPQDLEPALLAAVVEAASVHPKVSVQVGETELQTHLRWELRRDRFHALPPEPEGTRLTGSAPMLDKVRTKIERYGPTPYPVLIMGETGTGKELVARMLHERSARGGDGDEFGRFIPMNAAMLPPQLASSLLFGHLKGSFTGADRDRAGRIAEAKNGTFFLDEVFNLDPAVQGKLLRALNRVEEGVIEVEPVGSTKPATEVPVRLVVSALGDPRKNPAKEGQVAMRLDLFYRVAAGIIRLPPLRQIPQDLPAICRRLLQGLPDKPTLEPSAIEVLLEHDWPGNVRELKVVLLRALMDSGSPDLTEDAVKEALKSFVLPPGASALRVPCDLHLELRRIEVATLRAASRMAGHKKTEAGALVGMGSSSKNFGRRLKGAETALKAMETAPKDTDSQETEA